MGYRRFELYAVRPAHDRHQSEYLSRKYVSRSARAAGISLAALIALVLCFTPAPSRAHAAAARADRPWIFAADIHLDPTGRYGHGVLGSDSNPELLASAIRTMRRVDPDPPVVVLGGDFLAHVIDPKLAVPTIRSIARQFDRAFPNAQFVFVLGNEDSNCGDYAMPAGSPFLREVASAWAPLVNRRNAAPGFTRTFPADGFFVARLPVAGLRAVAIDDVFWSPRYRNACAGALRPGAETERDLDAALRAQPAEHTWVFAHIPPGIDAYSTAHITHGLVVVPFLDQRAKDAFVQSVADPSHDVNLIVAAHTHKFAFRVTGEADDAVPILLVPSVSPIFRNAPSFLTVHVDADRTIVSVDDWTRLNGAWADRGGLRTLGMPDVSTRSILALQRRLASDATLRATFARLYNGDAPPEITPQNWRVYWCAAADLSATAFRSCMAEGGYSILTGRAVKLLAVFVVAALALAGVLVKVARDRGKRSHVEREGRTP